MTDLDAMARAQGYPDYATMNAFLQRQSAGYRQNNGAVSSGGASGGRPTGYGAPDCRRAAHAELPVEPVQRDHGPYQQHVAEVNVPARITPELEAKLKSLATLKGDYPLYASKCLTIKTKTGKKEPFVFNRAQHFIHDRLEDQLRTTGMVRALVLKGRQQGASTYIGGRFYHRSSLTPGTNVYILTHEQPATDNLFGMVARYHEHTPLRPSTGAANAKELLFNKLDSGYAVATAGQKAAGRSKTIRLFHGSEVAFWPNASDHFASSVQAVPDLPGTEIILESTANGVVGEFYERWQKAEAGIGDYIAVFVPWFWDPGYTRPVPEGFYLSQEREGDDISEFEYHQLYGLEMGQMVWRRAKIAELGAMLFKQEYPATAEEAFQTTGHDSFIKSADILRARKANIEAHGALVIGVDPARFGDDLFAIAWRRGRKVTKTEGIQKCDVVAGANRMKQIIDADKPGKVFIDVGGVGAGVYDILVSWGEKYENLIEAVNFGDPAQEPIITLPSGEEKPGPKNRRAEMWGRSRDWLQQPGGADIPDEGVLQSDGCAPSYRYDASQNYILESKEQMRKRGVRSPDYWDAIALTFASEVRADIERHPPSDKFTAVRRATRKTTGWMAA